ncbi:MAG: lysogenization regulator HflD [Pseudomonadaceae bacterium]|nr:lysogenization regulator HflD [Pseudomonadaceae bacterium]
MPTDLQTPPGSGQPPALLSRLQEQALSLAGIVQSALLTHELASGKHPDSDELNALHRSTLRIDSESVVEAFGGDLQPWRRGLRTAVDILRKPPRELIPVLRYVITLVDVTRSLRKYPNIVARLGDKLSQIEALPIDAAPLDQERCYQQLAQAYKATLSTLPVRVQVSGSPELLAQDETASQIRAVLLGGVRFAWLWQQTGGRRWHLMFARGKIRAALIGLLRGAMTALPGGDNDKPPHSGDDA